MDGLFTKDTNMLEPITYFSLKTEEINPEKEIVSFVISRQNSERVAIFASKAQDLEIFKLIFTNFGVEILDQLKDLTKGKVFLGLEKEMEEGFDSAVFFECSEIALKKGMKLTPKQKFIISSSEPKVNVDSYKMDFSLETFYRIYKKGFIKLAKDFGEQLFSKDKMQMGILFSDSKYTNDMAFMGLATQMSSFDLIDLYEKFRLERNRESVLDYLKMNLVKLLRELEEKKAFYLMDSLIFDFNKELLLETALHYHLAIFDSFSEDMRYKFFVISDRKNETIREGINLRLWTELLVYQYGLMPLSFFDLEKLSKEVEYNSDEKLVIKLYEDFDNKRLLEIAVNNYFKSIADLPYYVKENIFVNVFDSKNSLEDGTMLGLWDAEKVYQYSLRHAETKESTDSFIESNFETFCFLIDKNNNSDLIQEVFKDFPLELIIARGLPLLKYLSSEKRKELYDSSIGTKEFSGFYEANTWRLSELFSWFLEDKNSEIKKVLKENLMALIQDINRTKNDYLFLQLFKEFDHNRVLVFAGNCNASYLFSKMIDSDRERLFNELCNRFDSVEAGIRLGVWKILDCYVFGLSNPMQKENIDKAIRRNMNLFVKSIESENRLDLINQVLLDFEIMDVFQEAYRARKNIFKLLNQNSKEILVKAFFDNASYLDFLVDENDFSSREIFEICSLNLCDCSKFYSRNMEGILPSMEPSIFLAHMVILSRTEEKSIELISKRFHRGRGKELKRMIDIERETPTIELTKKGNTGTLRPDLTVKEMLEIIGAKDEDTIRDN